MTQRWSVRQPFDNFTDSLTTYRKKVVTFGTPFEYIVFAVCIGYLTNAIVTGWIVQQDGQFKKG